MMGPGRPKQEHVENPEHNNPFNICTSTYKPMYRRPSKRKELELKSEQQDDSVSLKTCGLAGQ